MTMILYIYVYTCSKAIYILVFSINLQGNILQFYPSAYLYEPIDDVLEVKYSLKDLSKTEGSLVGVSVNSETVNDVRMCLCLLSICM